MKLKNLTSYIIFAIIAVIVLFFVYTNMQSGEKYNKTSFALNTYTTITAYGTGAQTAAENASKAVSDVESQMSAYIDSSELARLNASSKSGASVKVSDELFDIIKTAYKFSEITGGLFDITIKPVTDLWAISTNPRVPSNEEITQALDSVGYKNIVLNENEKTVTFLKDNVSLDLGAIAKGYAADKAVGVLANAGCKKALIDLGGNICLVGENLDTTDVLLNTYFGQNIKKPWRVGIQTPFSASGAYCVTLVVDSSAEPMSIVTSGAYERNFTQDSKMYHHILNPFTGYPHEGEIDSVTIIGTSSMEADALSTSAFMMSIDDALSLVHKCGYDALIIDKDKKIHTTLDKDSVIINDSEYSFAD